MSMRLRPKLRRVLEHVPVMVFAIWLAITIVLAHSATGQLRLWVIACWSFACLHTAMEHVTTPKALRWRSLVFDLWIVSTVVAIVYYIPRTAT